MNTHLKQLWAAMKLPEKLQKSYKFFCRGLDIRVPKIVDTNVRQIGYLGAAGQFFVEGCTGHVKYPVILGQAV